MKGFKINYLVELVTYRSPGESMKNTGQIMQEDKSFMK